MNTLTTCSHCNTEYKTEDSIRTAWDELDNNRKYVIQEYHDNQLIRCGDPSSTPDLCYNRICPGCMDKYQCKGCRAETRVCAEHLTDCTGCGDHYCTFDIQVCIGCNSDSCPAATCSYDCDNCEGVSCYKCLDLCKYVDKDGDKCMITVCGGVHVDGKKCKSKFGYHS
jgi:hypothetical protein